MPTSPSPRPSRPPAPRRRCTAISAPITWRSRLRPRSRSSTSTRVSASPTASTTTRPSSHSRKAFAPTPPAPCAGGGSPTRWAPTSIFRWTRPPFGRPMRPASRRSASPRRRRRESAPTSRPSPSATAQRRWQTARRSIRRTPRPWAALVTRFPDDDDAATLFAESLMDLRPWHYWTNAGRPHGSVDPIEQVEVLERSVMRNPDHPGACHFYIHAVEASNDAAKALPCARKPPDPRARRRPPGPHADPHLHAARHVGSGGRAQRACGGGGRAASSRIAIPTGVYPMGTTRTTRRHGRRRLPCSAGVAEAIAAARKIASIDPYDAGAPGAAGRSRIRGQATLRTGTVRQVGRDPEEACPTDPASATPSASGTMRRGSPSPPGGKSDSAGVEHDSVRPRSPRSIPMMSRRPQSGQVGSGVAEQPFDAAMADRQGNRDEAMSALKEGIALEDELTYSASRQTGICRSASHSATCSSPPGRRRKPSGAYRDDLVRHPQQRLVAARARAGPARAEPQTRGRCGRERLHGSGPRRM